MVQAGTDASIMRRLQNFFASVLASCIDADYRGSGNRCLTIKNNYVISVPDHQHAKFGERNRYGLSTQRLEKQLVSDPGCDLTKVRDRRIVRVGIPCGDQLIRREQFVKRYVDDVELLDARNPLRHQRNAQARANEREESVKLFGLLDDSRRKAGRSTARDDDFQNPAVHSPWK